MNAGDRIVDNHGRHGTVTEVLDGLDAACERGYLGPTSAGAIIRGDTRDCHAAVSTWLHKQERVPRTPRKGRWLAVDIDGGGAVLVGELDATPEAT